MAGSDRITLITGASRGIGRACADRLTAAGHHIVNLDLSAPDEAFKGDFYEVDLGDRRAVGACLERLSQQYEFNGLLNNVGTTGEQSLEDIELDVFDRVMEVNVVTAIQCAKACIPSMKAQRFGRIVNVSSELILGIAKRTAYAGTKAMLSNVARIWSLELTPFGITVNAIAPGPTNTEFFMKQQPDREPATGGEAQAHCSRAVRGAGGHGEHGGLPHEGGVGVRHRSDIVRLRGLQHRQRFPAVAHRRRPPLRSCNAMDEPAPAAQSN